jgi:hypothetical protein
MFMIKISHHEKISTTVSSNGLEMLARSAAGATAVPGVTTVGANSAVGSSTVGTTGVISEHPNVTVITKAAETKKVVSQTTSCTKEPSTYPPRATFPPNFMYF